MSAAGGTDLAAASSDGIAPVGRSRLRARGSAKILAGCILVGLVLLLVAYSWVIPIDPLRQVLTERLRPPLFFGGTTAHILGTDQLGRDMLSRLMYGGRVDLAIALLAIVLSVSLGVVLGLCAAFYGRALDAFLTMAAAVQLALPTVLVIVLLLALLGPSIVTIALILAVSDWVLYARIVRGRAISELARDYIVAARLVGNSDARLIFRHILPNVASTISVLATVSLGHVVLFQASLSYLGLGVQRPYAAWGRMVSEGQAYLSDGWWMSTFPALAIGVLVVGVNLLGDGLRERWKME